MVYGGMSTLWCRRRLRCPSSWALSSSSSSSFVVRRPLSLSSSFFVVCCLIHYSVLCFPRSVSGFINARMLLGVSFNPAPRPPSSVVVVCRCLSVSSFVGVRRRPSSFARLLVSSSVVLRRCLLICVDGGKKTRALL